MDLRRVGAPTTGQIIPASRKWYVHRSYKPGASTYDLFAQISTFLNDFSDALNRSLALDNKILSASSAVSPEYASVLSLVTRQIFASMDITVPSAEPGQFNTSDVKIFMKDIGQSRSVPLLYLAAVQVSHTSIDEQTLLKLSMARSQLSFSSTHPSLVIYSGLCSTFSLLHNTPILTLPLISVG